jgi:1,4-alpha-glucan branching enzyme
MMLPDPHALTDQDLHLFNEGTHVRLWEKLGSHPTTVDGRAGTRFAVWAPNAEHVSVVGDWNGWSRGADALKPIGSSGIWETFIPGIARGVTYKYHLRSRERGYRVDKADPFAVHAEVAPKTASVVWSLEYEWGDAEWMQRRARTPAHAEPISNKQQHTR